MDQHLINLAKLNYTRVKLEVGKVCPMSEPIIVSDGFKEYKVITFHAILGEYFNLIMNMQLRMEIEKEGSCNGSFLAGVSL